jgi:uncharacterized membrane protein (GlpM family)
MVQIIIKAVVSVAVILTATGIARRFPSLAGLIAVMPITSVLVLVWVYLDNRGDKAVMQHLAVGSLWGLIPAILFFLTALIGFQKGFSLPIVLSASFLFWLLGAFVHQLILG